MNNKIMMSLVAASIAAMAAAPDLIKEEAKNKDKEKTQENAENVIKLNKLNTDSSSVSPEAKAELQKEVDVLLARKSSTMKMSESISVLVDNYGNDKGSIKDNIYKELNLGAQQDSVMVAPTPTYPGLISSTPTGRVCHSACHGACHSACHGSRGWR